MKGSFPTHTPTHYSCISLIKSTLCCSIYACYEYCLLFFFTSQWSQNVEEKGKNFGLEFLLSLKFTFERTFLSFLFLFIFFFFCFGLYMQYSDTNAIETSPQYPVFLTCYWVSDSSQKHGNVFIKIFLPFIFTIFPLFLLFFCSPLYSPSCFLLLLFG